MFLGEVCPGLQVDTVQQWTDLYQAAGLTDLQVTDGPFEMTANPFLWADPQPGQHVVDLGSGAGMDAFLAALWVGPTGRVIGIDMTPEMLTRSRQLAEQLDLGNVEFRESVIEELPVEDGWADVVISNRVVNLCPDKVGVYREVHRVLRPGGRMRIADICVQRPVPEAALHDIDL